MSKQDGSQEGATPGWKRALEFLRAQAAEGKLSAEFDPTKALSISWKTYEEAAKSLHKYLSTTKKSGEPLTRSSLPPEIVYALEERGIEIDKDEDWRIRDCITAAIKILESRGQKSYPAPSGENTGIDNSSGSAAMQTNTYRTRKGRDTTSNNQ